MPGTYIEIVQKGTLLANGSNAKSVANVYHYRRSTVGSALVKANINTAFQTAINTALLAASQADYVQAGSTVRWLDDATDPPVTFANSGVGAIATDRMPDFTSVCIQIHSAIKGKSGRGSKHYPGIAEAHTTGDILTGTGLTLWTAVKTALGASFTDSDGNVWVLGVNSHKAPAQWVVNPVVIVWNDMTSVLLNKTLGTMRRRKAKTVN